MALAFLWYWLVRAPREVATDAVARAKAAEDELAELKDRRAQNRTTRERLAELIERGDEAWNVAHMAHEVDENNNPPTAAAVNPGFLGGPPEWPQTPIPEWWKDVQAWLDEVETYLAGLGEEYIRLFRSHEDAVVSARPEGPRLSTRVRTEADMTLIRLKQDKLREFMKDFKD